MEKGKLNRLNALDVSHTHALSENAIYQLIQTHGMNLKGLMIAGKPKLTENFWLNAIPYLKNIRYVFSLRSIVPTQSNFLVLKCRNRNYSHKAVDFYLPKISLKGTEIIQTFRLSVGFYTFF